MSHGILIYGHSKLTVSGRSKHTYTHVSNAVTLVWGSLRLVRLHQMVAATTVIIQCNYPP